ncbi:MAG: beta-eliminating lyase-related protein [Promicromonosporaceae bacterium]|nr:beta-eliminating lyase-related protein [Promicromonosporaceae bacterium]
MSNLPPFGSDNYAPVHPEVLRALEAANSGFAVAYGDDDVSAAWEACAERLFGPGTVTFPVFNGTGANVAALMSTAPRWAGVIASDVAHCHTDENGAPERVGGLKLLVSSSVDGKLSVSDVERWASERDDVHRAQPSVLTLTQATELGTVYTPEELRNLTAAAHGLGMAVHVDGARLANAAATLGTTLRQVTADLGVDLISLGAAKNGGMIGEAIVVVGPDQAPTERAAAHRATAAAALPYLRKQTMQLASKHRFLAAQLLALFDGDLWLRNATSANLAALRLGAGLAAVPGVRVSRPTEANAVFATMPQALADEVRRFTQFYDWAPGEEPDRTEVRLMCSWNTGNAEVDALVAAFTAAA